MEDQSQIQRLAVNHFSSVANSIHPDPSDSLFGIDSYIGTTDQNSLLSIIPDAEEIRGAVFISKGKALLARMVSQVIFSLPPGTSLAPL